MLLLACYAGGAGFGVYCVIIFLNWLVMLADLVFGVGKMLWTPWMMVCLRSFCLMRCGVVILVCVVFEVPLVRLWL